MQAVKLKSCVPIRVLTEDEFWESLEEHASLSQIKTYRSREPFSIP